MSTGYITAHKRDYERSSSSRTTYEVGSRHSGERGDSDDRAIKCTTCGDEHMIYIRESKYTKAVIERINGQSFRIVKEITIPGGMDICPTCVKRCEAQYRTQI